MTNITVIQQIGIKLKPLIKFPCNKVVLHAKTLFIAGESVLHVAIVNEDPSMVKYLLDSGADFHERCFGNFMSSEDQKASRSDSLDHEWVNIQPETNYEG